jgi:hypothetical protein
MTTMTFDTLKFANKLKAVGVPSAHAEAEAEALAEVFDVNLREIATHEDMKRLEEKLSERLTTGLAQLEQRMTIKLGTLMVIAVGATASLVKLL